MKATQAGPAAIVLRTAGTNCERETVHALELAGAQVDLVHLHRVVADPSRLAGYRMLVLPGGFSYGDDVAAGRVFGLELRHHLADALRTFVAEGGFVLGVCNGFQVLCETGLLEQCPAAERTVTLYANASNRFECRWVTVESLDSCCPWLRAGERTPMPVAHAEGRFVVADDEALERLRGRGQIALRYTAPDGGPARYPDNPNGSVEAIAGICDPTGRVLGLMPHPERNVRPTHHPRWTALGARSEGEGLSFYRRMVELAATNAETQTTSNRS